MALYRQTFTGNGVATAFTLSQQVNSSYHPSILIWTSDQSAPRPQADYTLGNTGPDGRTVVTFTTAPGNGVRIEILIYNG